MARPKRADRLDQIILETKPGKTPTADFDAWRNAHAGAIRRLRQQGAALPHRGPFLTSISRLARDITRNPIARLAIAAAIIAGVLVLATSRTGHRPSSAGPPATVADQTPDGIDPQEDELRLANELFIQGDVEGLLALLHTTQPRTAFVAVAYLGEIGDASSLPTLQAFAAQWEGPTQENPFQKAIDQIRLKNGENDARPAEQTQAPTVIVPSALESPSSLSKGPPLTCRGVVVDKTGMPISGARVWAQSCTKDSKLTDLTTHVQTDPQGRFSLTTPGGDPSANDWTYLACRHGSYALGWLRLPADRETTDFNDCRIILYEPTFVAGAVTDTQGRAIAGALVEARIVPVHEPTSSQEYPYTTGNERAIKTDVAGRFILKDVPEDSLLSLSVLRRGYGSYDSREGYGSLLGTSPYLDSESHTVRAGREDVRIELLSAKGRIDGRIVDVHGSPYDGAVVLRCEDSNLILAGLGYSYSNERCVPMEVSQRGVCSSNDGGRFRIEDLPAGEYVVAAADPTSGNTITAAARTTISRSQPRSNVTLRVGTMVDVRIRVRRRTGEPVGNVLLVLNDGHATHEYTDPNGSCVLHLVRGNYAIRARCRACKSADAVIRESYASGGPPVDIVVKALPELGGKLLDESGAPVRGWVRPFVRERILTDAEGRFVTAKNWENEMYLARNIEGTLARFCSGMASIGGTELEFRLEPLAVFSGRVLDNDGTPVDDARVTFSLTAPGLDPGGHSDLDPLDYGHAAGTLRCSVFLFAGRFHLEVPVGVRLALVASRNGYQGRSESIDPAPGQAYDLGDIVLEPVPSQNP